MPINSHRWETTCYYCYTISITRQWVLLSFYVTAFSRFCNFQSSGTVLFLHKHPNFVKMGVTSGELRLPLTFAQVVGPLLFQRKMAKRREKSKQKYKWALARFHQTPFFLQRCNAKSYQRNGWPWKLLHVVEPHAHCMQKIFMETDADSMKKVSLCKEPARGCCAPRASFRCKSWWESAGQHFQGYGEDQKEGWGWG